MCNVCWNNKETGSDSLQITPAFVERAILSFTKMIPNLTEGTPTRISAEMALRDLQTLSLELAAGTQEGALTPLASAALETQIQFERFVMERVLDGDRY